MNEFTIENAWPKPPAAVQQEAVRFWLQESALSEGKAMERARQLLVVSRETETRQVVAVTTAVPALISHLGLRCFYFRVFVGKAHRASGLLSSRLAHRLIRESYDVINGRYQRGIDTDVCGMYLVIENKNVIRRRPQLIWKDLGANIVFTGFLADGRQTRVWYFENATIPERQYSVADSL